MQNKELKLDSIESIEKEIDKHVLSNKEIALNQLNKILSLLPIEIATLIEGAFKYQRIPKEYMLSAVLFAFSNAAGLAFKINCMNYTNYSNLYFALIGSRGDTKSPAMDLAIGPLNNYDSREYTEYKIKEKQIQDALPNEAEEVIRKQLFVQNATIEAAMFTHYKNPYSIGVFIDELSFLIEKMANKNNSEGAVWRTFLLQGNTNKHVDVSRRTTDSYRIEKSYPTLLGSIQYQFIPKMFANGNLESGLIDRLLFTYKLTSNKKISKEIFPSSIVENYSVLLTNLFSYRRSIEETKHEFSVLLDESANSKIISYSQDILNKQDNLGDYEKEYTSKMMINIHKLTLLAHLIKNASIQSFQSKITTKSVDLAILLNEFYFTNFKIVLENKGKVFDEKYFTKEVFLRAIKNGASQTDVIKITALSKGQVSKKWNQYLEEGNWKLETNQQNS